MACACRALRALTLARAPFPRPALSAPSYRAYSTGPSDTPPDPPSSAPSDKTSKPAKAATDSTTPPVFRPKPKEPSDTPKEASSDTPKPRRRRTIAPKDPPPNDDKSEHWKAQKDALQKKFPLGWAPPKKLSPDALNGMRALHKQFPETYTTPALADLFQVSPEAVRRILKSKWGPQTEAEEEERRKRWVRRGHRVWQRWSELGVKVPRSWRPEGTSKWGGKVQNPEEGAQDPEGEGFERPQLLAGSHGHKKALNWGMRARRNVTKRIM